MTFLNKKAFAVVEYAVLFIIIIGAFVIMRKYIQRGVFGLWQQSGQSYAFGRQYDPQRTIECGFDDQSNVWYDRNCYLTTSSQYCNPGDTACQEFIMASVCTTSASSCSELN